jgi:hypothetical protein
MCGPPVGVRTTGGCADHRWADHERSGKCVPGRPACVLVRTYAHTLPPHSRTGRAVCNCKGLRAKCRSQRHVATSRGTSTDIRPAGISSPVWLPFFFLQIEERHQRHAAKWSEIRCPRGNTAQRLHTGACNVRRWRCVPREARVRNDSAISDHRARTIRLKSQPLWV